MAIRHEQVPVPLARTRPENEPTFARDLGPEQVGSGVGIGRERRSEREQRQFHIMIILWPGGAQLLQWPHPDVSEAHRAIMRAKGQRAFAARPSLVVNLVIQVHQHAIVQHGEAAGFDYFAVLHHGDGEKDVEGLPFSRRPGNVNQGRRLAIDSRALAIRVNLLVVGIEDLDFMTAKQEDTIVAALVPGRFKSCREQELDVNLRAAKLLLGDEIAFANHGCDDAAVLNRVVRRLPLAQALAIEQHHGIGGNGSGRAGLARVNAPRRRTVGIVLPPLTPGELP